MFQVGKWIYIFLHLCFNWAPHHEDILGEWRYSSPHSWCGH